MKNVFLALAFLVAVPAAFADETPAPQPPPSPAVVPLPPVPDDLRELAEQTRDPDWWLRKVAMIQLAETGRPEAVPLLIAGLKDNDRDVKKAAVEGLGKLRDPRAAKHLVAALRDDDVRREAVKVLLQYPPEQTLPLLRLALREHSMRDGAATVLARINTPESIAALMSGPTPDNLVRYLWDANPEAVAGALAVALQSPDAEQKVQLLQSLRVSTQKEQRAEDWKETIITHDAVIQAMIAATQAPDAPVRLEAVRTLASWMPVQVLVQGKAQPAALRRFVELTRDQNAPVRASAVHATGEALQADLNQGRPLPPELLDALVSALHDNNLGVGRGAALWINALQWEPERQEDRALLNAIAQSDPREPLTADALMHVLTAERVIETDGREVFTKTPQPVFDAVVQSKDSRFVEPLARLTQAPDAEEAHAAVAALGGMAIPEAIPPLLETLQNDALAEAAIHALAASVEPRVTDALAAKLDSPSPEIRLLAADTLGKQKAPQAVPALAAHIHTSHSELRTLVIAALGNIGTDEAVAALEQALQSPSLSASGKQEILSRLATMENPKGIEIVKRTFTDGPDELRISAARALLEAGTAEAKKFVAENSEKARDLFDKAIKENEYGRQMIEKVKGPLENLRRSLDK